MKSVPEARVLNIILDSRGPVCYALIFSSVGPGNRSDIFFGRGRLVSRKMPVEWR